MSGAGAANLDDGPDPGLRITGSFQFSIVELRDGAIAVQKHWIAAADAHEFGEHARFIWHGQHRDIQSARTVAERAAVTPLNWDNDPNVTIYPGAEPDIVRYLECTRNHVHRPLTRREANISGAARAARFELYGTDPDGAHSGPIPGEPRFDERVGPDLLVVRRLKFAIGELRDGSFALEQESTITLDRHRLAHPNTTIIWRGTRHELPAARATAQRVAVASLRWNSDPTTAPQPHHDAEIVRYTEATGHVTRQVTRRELDTALAARPIIGHAVRTTLQRAASHQPRRPDQRLGPGLDR